MSYKEKHEEKTAKWYPGSHDGAKQRIRTGMLTVFTIVEPQEVLMVSVPSGMK